MAANLVKKDGRYLELAIATKNSGDPTVLGSLHGVCLTDTDASGNVMVDTQGVYDLSVAGVNAGGNSAVAIGDSIYYTNGDTPKLNKKATGSFFGIALETVGSGSTATINVKVIPS